MSKFYKIFFSVIAAFLVLLVAGSVFLTVALADYEKNLPITAAEKFFSEQIKTAEFSGVEGSEFETREALVSAGFENVRLCIETMGKINQLGNLEEVMELCSLDESFLPCIDFGHLNARTFGEMNSKESFESALNLIENKLGFEKLNCFHSHFSKIEYTNGGEKRHLTFEDNVYGPDFEPLMELVYKYNLSPTFICESAGTQTEDVKQMMDYYNSLKGEV